jgi:hypothetical protein
MVVSSIILSYSPSSSFHTKNPARAGFFVWNLFRDIRKEAHESSAFDRIGEFALILGSDAGAALTHDLGIGVQKFLEDLNILVVDIFDVVC